MAHKRLLALMLIPVVGVLLSILSPWSGVRDVEHEATRVRLELMVSSSYEFHGTNGQWPTQIGDLGRTSLPVKSPYWRPPLDDGVYVVVWHKTLKPDPKDNADQILVYHDKGLIAARGQQW